MLQAVDVGELSLQAYLFCSRACGERFRASPERYLRVPAEAG